jgi:hypothetical protein
VLRSVQLILTIVALQLRLYALYDLDKALLAVTVPISGLTVVFAVAVHVWALAQGKIASHEIPGMPYCVSRGIPATYWILWLPIIAFEACLLGLVVRRAVIDDYAEVDSRRRASIDSIEQLTKPGCAVYKQHVRNPWRRATRVVELVAQTRRIFYVLVRDSVVYFFVCVCALSAPSRADGSQDVRELCDEPHRVGHGDGDYAGGLDPVLCRTRVCALLADAPERTRTGGGTAARRGRSWRELCAAA